MADSLSGKNIHIEESAVGSTLVAGDRNIVYVIQQTTEQKQEEPEPEDSAVIGPNPYRGLAAFRESDAGRYFGREDQIERLRLRLQKLYDQSAAPRLLPILGPSGCGKSSLARAGLIPALAREPLSGKERMRVAVLVPGERPLEALAGVLAKTATDDPLPFEKVKEFQRVLATPEETGEAASREYDGLRFIASQISDIRDTPLVILVDQFEEIYSLCKDPEQQQAFIDNLLHAASDSSGNVSVVITLRSDFWGETQRHKHLNQVIGSDWSVNVPAMTAKELRRAIAEPARQAGHPFEEAIIDLLVKDTEGREGVLPLLQFALTRIWEGLRDGKDPATTYREMGGVGGALAWKAQELYDKLAEPDREIARRVFVALVQLGEGTRDTRRRVNVDSLIARSDTPEAVRQTIRQFSLAEARLISLSGAEGQEAAEVTHEALFEHWQDLNDWLDSSRDDIRFKRRLEAAAQYWDKEGRPNGLLWRPPDLDLLRDFQRRTVLTGVEPDFWQEADRAEGRRKRNARWVTIGLAAGFGLASVSTVLALLNARAANRSQIEANLNSIRVLAQSSETLLASGDEFEALIMALRAGKQFQDGGFSDVVTLNAIKGAIYPILLSENRELNRLEGHSDSVLEVRFGPDGQTIATASRDGTAKLWKLDGTLIATLEGHSDPVSNVRFGPDGQTIATASDDGTAKLWKLDGTLIATLEGHRSSVRDVRFGPDGQTIATASDDGTAKLWKLDGTLIATSKAIATRLGR